MFRIHLATLSLLLSLFLSTSVALSQSGKLTATLEREEARAGSYSLQVELRREPVFLPRLLCSRRGLFREQQQGAGGEEFRERVSAEPEELRRCGNSQAGKAAVAQSRPAAARPAARQGQMLIMALTT